MPDIEKGNADCAETAEQTCVFAHERLLWFDCFRMYRPTSLTGIACTALGLRFEL